MKKHEDDARYEIKDKEAYERLITYSHVLQDIQPKGWGHCIFLFEFEGPAFFYSSDADRKDMIKALKEFIRREEGN